jgi:hypothetical protein
MVAFGLLVIPPAEAEIVTVPSAPALPVAVTVPAETVAMAVLLEVQVATLVTSTEPLHVCAMALILTLVVPPLVMLPLVGLSVIDWIQPTITVSDWVPVIDGFCVAVAVTVAVPVATDVTNPPGLIVATVLLGLTLQVTAGLPVLPSLNVPTANICTLLFVLPVWMLGDAGPTAMEDNVGFTKKPLQLTAKVRVASAAKAQVSRSFCVVDDILVETPWARLLDSYPVFISVGLQNCSREDFARPTLQYLNCGHGSISATLFRRSLRG